MNSTSPITPKDDEGQDMGALTGSRASMEPASSLHPSGFDPERKSDMDRAFEIALLTLHFSLHHTSQARKFYADGMNNNAGHLTPYMAARVIAATMAAHQAIKIERHLIVQYLNDCADGFSGVPLQAEKAGLDATKAAIYSFDAMLRYIGLAAQISDRVHVPAIAMETRRAETENTGSVAKP